MADNSGQSQFWKPGQPKPMTALPRNPSARKKDGKGEKRRRSDGGAQRREKGSGPGKRMDVVEGTGFRKPRPKSIGGIETKPSNGVATPQPSKGLLAMKFMQRHAESAKSAAKEEPAVDAKAGDTEWSRYTRQSGGGLVCIADEQEPRDLLLGRRSFGGFSPVVETAYDKCLQELKLRAKAAAAAAAAGGDDNDAADATGEEAELKKRFGGYINAGRKGGGGSSGGGGRGGGGGGGSSSGQKPSKRPRT